MHNSFITEKTLKDGRSVVFLCPSALYAAQSIDYLNMVGGESDNLLFGKNEFYMTLEQEAEYLQNMQDANNSLLIMGFVEDRLAGMAQLRGNQQQRAAHNFELSITVAKEFWGLGLGTEAMRILIGFAKEHGAKAVYLEVRADNAAAIHLYEKFGFEKIGLRQGYFNVGGVFYDEILMALYLD